MHLFESLLETLRFYEERLNIIVRETPDGAQILTRLFGASAVDPSQQTFTQIRVTVSPEDDKNTLRIFTDNGEYTETFDSEHDALGELTPYLTPWVGIIVKTALPDGGKYRVRIHEDCERPFRWEADWESGAETFDLTVPYDGETLVEFANRVAAEACAPGGQRFFSGLQLNTYIPFPGGETDLCDAASRLTAAVHAGDYVTAAEALIVILDGEEIRDWRNRWDTGPLIGAAITGDLDTLYRGAVEYADQIASLVSTVTDGGVGADELRDKAEDFLSVLFRAELVHLDANGEVKTQHGRGNPAMQGMRPNTLSMVADQDGNPLVDTRSYYDHPDRGDDVIIPDHARI